MYPIIFVVIDSYNLWINWFLNRQVWLWGTSCTFNRFPFTFWVLNWWYLEFLIRFFCPLSNHRTFSTIWKFSQSLFICLTPVWTLIQLISSTSDYFLSYGPISESLFQVSNPYTAVTFPSVSEISQKPNGIFLSSIPTRFSLPLPSNSYPIRSYQCQARSPWTTCKFDSR